MFLKMFFVHFDTVLYIKILPDMIILHGRLLI